LLLRRLLVHIHLIHSPASFFQHDWKTSGMQIRSLTPQIRSKDRCLLPRRLELPGPSTRQAEKFAAG
jgi:hypothetical protein